MAEIHKTDLCIIGAGAQGIALAMQARARNLKVMLVQRASDETGDLAQGALQRAAFMASAARAQAVRTAGDLGLPKAEPKPNFRTISERAAAIADGAATVTAPARLAALGITLSSEPAVFTDSRTLRVGNVLVRAGQFVLAMGSHAVIPSLPGLEQVDYFTPDTILANMRKLSHLVVLGGDPVALELAQAYRRLGSAVTLVPHGPLLEGFDPELVAVLLRALREEGVDILEAASVTAILPRGQGTGIAIAHADGALGTLDASHVLVALGRVPDLDPELLNAARLKRDRLRPDHLQVSPEGQTSNGLMTAIGGAAGVFDHQTTLRQATLVLQRACGEAGNRIDPRRVPRSVDTMPALAQIGHTGAATPLLAGQMVLRASASETEAARASSDLRGSAKLVVDANGVILGGAVLGTGAAEMTAMLALALDRDLNAADLADLLMPSTGSAALLADIGRQFGALHRPSVWARRRAALRRLLP